LLTTILQRGVGPVPSMPMPEAGSHLGGSRIMRPRPSYASLLLVLGLLVGLVGSAGAVVINEIRPDQTSADNDEYFELRGSPGESLNDLTYIVIGDGTGGSGVIENVTSLAGLSIAGDTEYFLAAEATFSLNGVTPDLITTLGFENSDQYTHMLVSGFTGFLGQDLDTLDACVLDITPWTSIVDKVAFVGDGSDCTYGPPDVGPTNQGTPFHIYRCGDDPNTWVGDDDQGPGPSDTPRAANVSCANPVPSINFLNRAPCVPDANVDADITINTSNTTSATLYYSVNGGGFSSVAMTTSDNITYSGTIPGTAYVDGDVVSYFVTLDNGSGDTLDSYERGFFAGPSAKDINDLRVNDVDGRNIYDGYGVHIAGVTTVGYGVFDGTTASDNTDYFIQDGTGGINVFKFGQHTVQPNLGDAVEIWGSLDQYNGKLEITDGDCDTLEVELVGPGVVPSPAPIECWELGEAVEGLLISTRVLLPDSLVGMTTPTGNTNINFGQSGCESKLLFFDADAGLGGISIPYRVVDVVGIASQFDFSAPYDGFYEIVPRYTTDLTFLSGPLGVGDGANGSVLRLMQNIPNPVTSATQIRFQIPPAAAGKGTTPVRIDLFDLQGRLVKTVLDREMDQGEYQVNLGPAEIGDLSNGVYFYSLTAGNQKKTMKLMLLH